MDKEVISSLVIARHHLHNCEFAGTARHAIAEGYSAIDAVLSALIISKSVEPPRNHKAKLDLARATFPDVFQNYEEKYPTGRGFFPGVDWDELIAFYKEWLAARYEEFDARPAHVGGRRAEAEAAFRCAVRRLAADWGVPASDVDKRVEELSLGAGVSEVERALGEAHDRRFADAEAYGERYGAKLGTKMSETSNFATLSIIADDTLTQSIIREDREIADECAVLYLRFLGLVEKIQERRLAHFAGDRYPDDIDASHLEEAPNLIISLKARYSGATVSEFGESIGRMLANAMKMVAKHEPTAPTS